jgi:hypothetical protein
MNLGLKRMYRLLLRSIMISSTWAATLGVPSTAQAQQPRRIPIGLNGVPQPGVSRDWKIAEEFQIDFFKAQFPWHEHNPGKYSWPDSVEKDEFKDHLVALKRRHYTISITCTVVHMERKYLPPYLDGRRFNDDYLLERWETYLRAFLARYGSEIDFLNIGNEVNAYFGSHRNEWKDYVAFVKRGSEVIRESTPAIRIGVVLEAGNLEPYWHDVEPFCDYLAVTYYTPCSAFTKSPTAEALDPDSDQYFQKALNEVIRSAGNKQVLITEIGCATHEAVDSSPELQAAFIRQLFEWLRDDKQDKILGVSWLSHIDWPYEGTKTALEGQFDAQVLNHEPFIRYLTSLGLMYEDGTKKPGYDVFKREVLRYHRSE